MKAECREHCGADDGGVGPTGDEWVKKVFDGVFALDPIQWVRVHDFQVQSVKMVVQRALPHLPFYIKHPGALEGGLKLPGELPPHALADPTTLLVCTANRGARDVAEEVKLSAEDSCSAAVSVAEAATVLATQPSHTAGKPFLILYLNEDTFLDAGGTVAAMVKRSINLKIPIAMVHEQDAAKGACPFRIFFDQTPKELIVAPYKLFAPMAVPLYPAAEHRKVRYDRSHARMLRV